MTDGEKMVWAAAFAMVAANPGHDNKQSREVAAIAGATADEALRLLRIRADADADARSLVAMPPTDLDEAKLLAVRLWNKAVGTPGYDKQEWIRLQLLLGNDS